jgi:hypothetical protein
MSGGNECRSKILLDMQAGRVRRQNQLNNQTRNARRDRSFAQGWIAKSAAAPNPSCNRPSRINAPVRNLDTRQAAFAVGGRVAPSGLRLRLSGTRFSATPHPGARSPAAGCLAPRAVCRCQAFPRRMPEPGEPAAGGAPPGPAVAIAAAPKPRPPVPSARDRRPPASPRSRAAFAPASTPQRLRVPAAKRPPDLGNRPGRRPSGRAARRFAARPHGSEAAAHAAAQASRRKKPSSNRSPR